MGIKKSSQTHVLFAVVAVLCYAQIKGVLSDQVKDEQSYEVTYPERTDSDRQKRDLSTLHEDGHVDYARYTVNAFKRSFPLKLSRNRELISPRTKLRYFNENGQEVLETVDHKRHCHYQGMVEGEENSHVILNTCSGLRGYIQTAQHSFHIEPHDELGDGAHKIFHAKIDSTQQDCGLEQVGRGKRDDTTYEDPLMELEKYYSQFLTTKETRYAEVVFTAGYELWKHFKSDRSYALERILALANAVDEIYRRINIRIVVVGIDLWTDENKFVRSRNSITELHNYEKYKQTVLEDLFHPDNAQFLSYRTWDDAGGRASLGSMCKPKNSAGANNWWSDLGSLGPWVTVAHEMGHNFGMNHDASHKGVKCTCPTRHGCIQGGHKARIPGFSSCSLSDLASLHDVCLYNTPTKSVNAVCGNGIKEEGEECDCGSQESCAKLDPCCKPNDCKLKESSQCSDLHHGCCKDCLFKARGSLCRGIKNDCDVSETCSGTSGECPSDQYKQNGETCTSTTSVFEVKTNDPQQVNHVSLKPNILTRYLRFGIQKENGQKICVKVTPQNCGTLHDPSGKKTSLRTGNGLCIVPVSGGCSASSGVRLTYSEGVDGRCSQPHMQFEYDESMEQLKHACSGLFVCTVNDRVSSTNFLELRSSPCPSVRWTRTKGSSLKAKRAGCGYCGNYCAHPNGGRPRVGAEVLLYWGCDEERLRIDMPDKDCLYPVSQPRMWCHNKENVEFDFGQDKEVDKVTVQGNGAGQSVLFSLYSSDDGQNWTPYADHSSAGEPESYCYTGQCVTSRTKQCQSLWGKAAFNGADVCYNTLNTNGQGYGTCLPEQNVPCGAQDVSCGQIQCSASTSKPLLVNYGTDYKNFTLSGQVCSAAKLMKGDALGLGMVEDGTKCGQQKMCKDYKCQTFDQLGIQSCPKVNGKECAGRGVCATGRVCSCDNGFDPNTNCATALPVTDGAWGAWSAWSACSRECDGGVRRRHRFCDNPKPANQGTFCPGQRLQAEECNKSPCPVAHSCRHLQQIGSASNQVFTDGVYTINPGGQGQVKTYCDMSRDGGGWTLLVTSHTDTWTKEMIKMRNEGSPHLFKDFSILGKANLIKDFSKVEGSVFEYRLEANKFGRWGGIWEAPRSYSFVHTSNSQTSVTLKKKFDNWRFAYKSAIENRMPWIDGSWLTTSSRYKKFGSIIANVPGYHPAPWIKLQYMERRPENIWYWMREGPMKVTDPSTLPTSCLSARLQGRLPEPDGSIEIRLPSGEVIKVICDVSSFGGGWTLLVTSVSRQGWDGQSVKERSKDYPSLDSDYSILLRGDQIAQDSNPMGWYQYRIEADGRNAWGGIWSAPASYSFLSTDKTKTQINKVKIFNSWDPDSNALGKRMPYIGTAGLFTSAPDSSDQSGTIISSSAGTSYIPGAKPNPSVVRVWVRQGAGKSCGETKQRSAEAGQQLSSGDFMISTDGLNYQSRYCDMSEDVQPRQSPIRSTYTTPLCVEPETRDCLPHEGASLQFTAGTDCAKHPHMMFTLDTEGVLRHECSRMFVCPAEGKFGDNSKVVLRSKGCGRDYAKYERTPGKSLKHKKSGKCIHPNGGTPRVGTELVYYSGCDSARIALDMYLLDVTPTTLPPTTLPPTTASPVVLTPLVSFTNLCVKPQTGGCAPGEGTLLTYAQQVNGKCSDDDMMFLYDKQTGLLKHRCSGMNVCPKDSTLRDNSYIVLSSKCPDSQAKWTRTSGLSLRFSSSTNKCIHPLNGTAKLGAVFVIYNGCSGDRLQIKMPLLV